MHDIRINVISDWWWPRKKYVLFWSRQLSKVMSLENIELWGRDGGNGRPLYLMKVVWTARWDKVQQRLFCLYFLGAPPIKQSLHCYKRLSWLSAPSEKSHWKTKMPTVNTGALFIFTPCWKCFPVHGRRYFTFAHAGKVWGSWSDSKANTTEEIPATSWVPATACTWTRAWT